MLRNSALVVFTMRGCSHCKLAKALLRERLGKDEECVREVDIDAHPAVYDAFQRWSRHVTLPLILFSDGTLVGGRDSLTALFARVACNDVSPASMIEALRLDAARRVPQPVAEPPPPLELLSCEGPVFSEVPPMNADLVELLSLDAPLVPSHAETLCSLLHHLRWSAGTDLVIKDRGCLWWRQRQTFASDALVESLVKHFGDKGAAARAHDALLASGALIVRSERDTTPVLLSFTYDWAQDVSKCINRHVSDCRKATAPVAISAPSMSTLGRALAASMLTWKESFTTAAGTVRYRSMTDSVLHVRHGLLTTLLHEMSREALVASGVAERMAFFINVYNAMVPHAFAMRLNDGPPKGMLQLYGFFNGPTYSIAGLPLTLDQIENGVLRGNRKGVGALFAPFSSSDTERLALCVPHDKVDYRIHFALNCGAMGCPPVKVYSAEHLDEQLDKAANAFLSQATRFDAMSATLTTSQIVDWYRTDFGATTSDVLDTLLRHLPGEVVAAVRASPGKVALRFDPYDWSNDDDDGGGGD